MKKARLLAASFGLACLLAAEPVLAAQCGGEFSIWLATFRREHNVLAFKGGLMNGDALTIEQLEALSKLPARDVLHGQLVGMIASPITGLVRGLNALISGLAIQLQQIVEQGLVGGDEPAAEEAPAEEAEEAPAEIDKAPAGEAAADEPEAAAAGDETEQTDAPSEGDETE